MVSTFEEIGAPVGRAEAARLAALESYAVLDTEREAAFDEIAQLAADIFDAPIAVVNFVADGRQWFKAEVGIGKRELPLDVSICRHALLQPGVFVVPDLAADPRFDCNPLVAVDGGLRFYAGALLETPEGLPLGTLCVLDTKPRPEGITERQQRTLKTLASQTMAQLELRRSSAALRASEARLRFLDDLAAATQPLTDATVVMSTTARLLGEHMALSICAYADMDEDEDGFTIRGDWAAPGARTIVGHYSLANFGKLAVKNLSAGQPFVMRNLNELAPEEAATFQSLGLAATICMPLVKSGRLTALMAVHSATPRDWSEADLALVGETTERSWAHIERVRSEAAVRESEARFEAIANSVDQMIWSTRPDGFHDYYNDRWYEYTGVPQGSTDGEAWNNVFHPQDQERAWAAWRHCLETGDPYHIEYRLRHNSGEYRWVIGRARPVRDINGSIERWYGTCTDIHDQKRAEDELRRTSALLALIGDSAPDLIYAKDRQSRVLYANAAASRTIGQPLDRIVGRTDRDWATDLEEAETILKNDRRVIDGGETLDVDEAFTGPSGEVRHYRTVKSPLRDTTGEIIGLVGISSDVTERRQAEERERLLAREVDHRAKNMLAVVQSIVQLTRAEDVKTFAVSIAGRIQSLARAHSLLAASRWEGADLKQLVVEELAPFTGRDTSRVKISGTAIRLKPEAAQALALVIHELATNAAKYGSLSAEGGELEIVWNVAGDRVDGSQLNLCWRERGGPPAAPPTRRGFGSTVMRASVERQLKGAVTLDWSLAGLVCELMLPAEQLVETSASASTEKPRRGAPASVPAQRAEGRRILVLEDEALIAMQIEDALDALGCHVVGPASRVTEAFDLIYAARVDAALLDINVAGERSFAVADILFAKGVPFAFVTGFDAASTIPGRFAAAPVIAKPFETAKLAAIVERLSTA